MIQIKGKVVPVLIKQHAQKAYWKRERKLHTFLTSALDGDELPESFPGPFTPEVRAPSSTEPNHPLNRRLGGPQTGPNSFGKRKIFASTANPTLNFMQNFYLYVI